MPLPFALVCDLLDECHRLCLVRRPNQQAVVDWFARHRGRIDAHDTNLSALLSTLLPEKRTDRVYCVQAASLEKIVGRALILGSSRIAELARYKQPGLGLDLADCVERILTVTPNPSYSDKHRVTVEEIDRILHGLASKIKWSSPAIRTSQATLTQRNRGDLEGVYRRLSAREAKWFTRLVLKDYQPLIFDSNLVYRCCNPMLPSIMKIQDDFAAAIKIVQDAKGKLLPNSTRAAPISGRALASVKPQLGIKVGRQNWFKARSMKHCVDMGHGRMSVENKIDGEYCQIHVDAANDPPRIQIFSKSGKDSTEDRQGLRGAILKSLRLGLPGSNIRKQCILEGELVVYSDLENKILPFHRIRNHVARRGRFMNTEDDTPPKPYEDLMIVYYDILLLDDQSLLDVRHSERFKMLEQTVHCDKGRAELVPRQTIDFGHGYAVSDLRNAFARVIKEKGEGLVLKPDDPYFNFHNSDRPFSGRCIKLKKEYIGNFGDVGDFAVVGAGFNAAKARSYRVPNLKWTHFYLGCLDNREQVKRWNATPEFTIISVVELNETQLKTLMSFGNPTPVPLPENNATTLKLPRGIETTTPLSVAFENPLVFDLRCFSFDKPGNTGFWTLRFPMVSKIHFDRDFSDTVSFEELQQMAKDSTTTPELEDSQENLVWIAKLEGADPRGRAVDAVSQLTATTMPTPSPMRSTQNTSCSDLRMSPVAVRSVGQVCESPERPRAPDQGTAQFAIPPVPLITPPTSSIPQETTPHRSASGGHQKRSSLPSVTSPPARKRQRSLDPDPLSSSPTQSRARRPLRDIDANASQHSATPCVESQKLEHQPRNNQPPAESEPNEDINAPCPQNDALARQPADAANGTTGPFSGEDGVGSPENVPSSPPGYSGKVLGSTAIPTNIQRCCSYVGGKCYLAGSAILLSASLTKATEPNALFKAHGIYETAIVDEWLESAKDGEASLSASKSGQNRILLVDSVESSETKALLARIEQARRDLPRPRRDWITVYDWRVLRYLSVLEDESITTKYYDGFHDPWRRWYCGMV
ncbi:DNA ligase 4 [Tolypocladium paradoxum]|uniref:DNA ligase 4 n=1 Tax=Tolypocladium paradoxum TaxID=94208 RepID=A0A2S4L0W2_9HYPO|nr:DNA ligase 4 [Tolypocladium paradoxum]